MVRNSGYSILIIILLALAMVLPGYSASTQSDIKIAAIFAKTGAAAPVDIQALEVLRWASNRVNSQGGVLGRQIDIIEYDNKSTSLGSLAASKQAVKDGVTAVIGASWSSHSLAIARVLQEAKIPMICPASTNPEVTKIGNYIFRVCATDSFMGKIMAHFALDHLHVQTAIVLTNANSQFSRDLATFFIVNFSQKGKVLWEGDYLQDSADFSPILNKVKTLNPDVIFVPGYPRDSGLILRQAKAMGIKGIFLGADGWNYLMEEYAGDAVDGNYFADHWHAGLPNPKSKAFLKEYEKDNPKVKIGLVPLTYDAFMLLMDSIKRADTTKTESVHEALASTRDFEGTTGKITFDANGDPLKPAVILKFENGVPLYYMTVGF